MYGIIKVLFIHQLMHQWVVWKKNIKMYIKIYIKTGPTSGSALVCAY